MISGRRVLLALGTAVLLSTTNGTLPVSTGAAAPVRQVDVFADAVAAQPEAQGATAPALTLAEARVIMEGAMAYARSLNQTISVAVLDAGGTLISQDRMDGGSMLGVRGAVGKAMAAIILRRPSADVVEWAQTEPDRYLSLLNVFPGQVYLTPGGVPLRVNGQIVGAVGVSGLARGVDDEAIEAGIRAWTAMRPGAGH